MSPRRYAVGILDGLRITLRATRLTVTEALARQIAFNHLHPTQTAVILRHPISAAIRKAAAKSRSAYTCVTSARACPR